MPISMPAFVAEAKAPAGAEGPQGRRWHPCLAVQRHAAGRAEALVAFMADFQQRHG